MNERASTVAAAGGGTAAVAAGYTHVISPVFAGVPVLLSALVPLISVSRPILTMWLDNLQERWLLGDDRRSDRMNLRDRGVPLPPAVSPAADQPNENGRPSSSGARAPQAWRGRRNPRR